MYIKAGIIFRGLFSVPPGEYLVPRYTLSLGIYGVRWQCKGYGLRVLALGDLPFPADLWQSSG